MLPHSASGKLKIPLGRLSCLLDEAVKKYHAPSYVIVSVELGLMRGATLGEKITYALRLEHVRNDSPSQNPITGRG
jgi:hypothetical protein